MQLDADFIAYESMLASQSTADFTFWIMVATFAAAAVSLLSAFVTLKALLVARRGLHSWKEQQIYTSKAEWVSSLVSYASGVSYLPDHIDYKITSDKPHLDEAAKLMYECIRCWKKLDVHLQLSVDHFEKFHHTYDKDWQTFTIEMHNDYMSGKISRDQLKQWAIHLYNL
ncbi:hypothetical protein [Kluyvera sichuanensis]|uniref:hypothetical protein n=1 Tax=Kluyvera sichuanensis TaxID=2725494 RepID=UPI0039F55D21